MRARQEVKAQLVSAAAAPIAFGLRGLVLHFRRLRRLGLFRRSFTRRTLITLLVFVWSTEAQTLRKVATIELPGPKGQRFDYLTMDDDDHWLLSAHLGPGILYVIDVRTNQLVKAIPGVPGIAGLEYVPQLRKVYTSDWGEEKIGIVDLQSMNIVKRLATAAKPNGSTYAAPFHKLYVVDTLGKAVAVVDVQKDEIVKTLEFKSETGMPQYDSVSRKICVNLRNTNEIAEIDAATDTVLGTYPVEGCRYNHGMAVDSKHRRAFLLCNGTKTLTVFALDTHKAITHLPIPTGADVVRFDPGLGRIYAHVRVVSSRFSRKMTRITIESSRILQSRKWYTALLLTQRRTEFTRRSSKKTDRRLLG